MLRRLAAEFSTSERIGAFQGCGDEAGKERVRVVRLGLEFRVELRTNVERVVGEFDDFNQAFCGGD